MLKVAFKKWTQKITETKQIKLTGAARCCHLTEQSRIPTTALYGNFRSISRIANLKNCKCQELQMSRIANLKNCKSQELQISIMANPVLILLICNVPQWHSSKHTILPKTINNCRYLTLLCDNLKNRLFWRNILFFKLSHNRVR
jgi:hypothetical protein